MTLSIVIPSLYRYKLLLALLRQIIEGNNPDHCIKEIQILVTVLDKNTELSKLAKNNVLKIIYAQERNASYARNIALAYATKDFVLFLDDDVSIPNCFFASLCEVLKLDDFDCFGGMYYPYYPEGKPKWLPESFGRKTPLRNDTGLIDVSEHGFLSAGIMCVRRAAMERVGGFSNNLGMVEGIGYGEEDDLQIRLQLAGYRIGFVPDWWLYHAVLPHKHKVSWHLQSAFARGRDGQRIHKKWDRWNAILSTTKGLGGMVYRSFKCGSKLAIEKEYYWQNFVVDVFSPFLNICGRCFSTFRY